jgi:hypothetical protein
MWDQGVGRTLLLPEEFFGGSDEESLWATCMPLNDPTRPDLRQDSTILRDVLSDDARCQALPRGDTFRPAGPG